MSKRFLIWYWSGGGGGSTFAVNLARRLSLRFGAGAVTLSLRADDPTLPRARALGLEVRAADIVSNRRKPLATIAALARGHNILAEHARDADVVIVPMNFASAAPLSAGLMQPLVYFAHDPQPHPGDYARNLQRITQGLLLRRSTYVVGVSGYAANLLRRVPGVAAKLQTAPLSAVFEPRAQPTTLARTKAPVRFLCAGRMIGYKGLDILASALRGIESRSDWRLVIAGDGPALTESIQSQLRGPQIELRRGWMSEAELEDLIASCDVLLAPYSSATQSGVVAQALAYGKPCVVTPVGALPEQLGDGLGGWVASAPNANAYSDVLVQSVTDGRARREKTAGAFATARSAWQAECWDWLA